MKLIIEPGTAAAHYWRDLWRYRELLYFLAWRDLVVRYKQTAIGVTWVLLRPALTMAAFVAFRRLVGAPAGSVPEPVLVFAAVLPWQFFSTALVDASGSLIGNANLLSKVYFPRLIIPAAAVITAIVDFTMTLALLAILMAWYGITPTPTVAFLPVVVVLTIGLSLGAGVFLAALNVQYRDFRYVVPFVVQMGLFVSPIAFTTADLPQRWRTVYSLNPMVGIIDGFRWSILGDRVAIDPSSIAISASVTAACLAIGVWYFRRMERSFADVI
ncbi:MAG: ABC transporter permease [Acidobacteriota bacterium]